VETSPRPIVRLRPVRRQRRANIPMPADP